jgi:threonine synthase
MRYVSIRGAGLTGGAPQPFSAILLEGLAPDGGLVVPEAYPRFSEGELAGLRRSSYRELAFAILSRYADDIPPSDLKAIVDRTYTAATFGSDEITPLATLEPGLFLLRLANGPTLAFKDIALQLLGRLFEHVLAKERATLNVLGATSGDTSSAAEHALRGKRGVNVFMLSPKGRMSPFQTAQMYSLTDGNIFNMAIDGVFDECQDIVKAAAGDAEFKARYRLGAVNSINWARVAAQIVYYFKGYFAATQRDGEEVAFAVPSGNFGNIFAGYVARDGTADPPSDPPPTERRARRVLPHRQLSRAQGGGTIARRVRRWISQGVELERYIFDMVGRDPAVVRDLWQRIERSGGFDLAGTSHWSRVLASGFVSGRSTHADRIATIREVFRRYRVIVDPHTADGIKIGLEHREPGVPLICIETAQPAKFAETIFEALGRGPDRPPGFEHLERLPQRCDVLLADVGAVKAYIAARAQA